MGNKSKPESSEQQNENSKDSDARKQHEVSNNEQEYTRHIKFIIIYSEKVAKESARRQDAAREKEIEEQRAQNSVQVSSSKSPKI
jgi:hypothetical protein